MYIYIYIYICIMGKVDHTVKWLFILHLVNGWMVLPPPAHCPHVAGEDGAEVCHLGRWKAHTPGGRRWCWWWSPRWSITFRTQPCVKLLSRCCFVDLNSMVMVWKWYGNGMVYELWLLLVVLLALWRGSEEIQCKYGPCLLPHSRIHRLIHLLQGMSMFNDYIECL